MTKTNKLYKSTEKSQQPKQYAQHRKSNPFFGEQVCGQRVRGRRHQIAARHL
jgi:hypothetical protein